MRIYFFISVCVASLFLTACRESRLKDHPEWKAAFDSRGISNGCFILRDNNHESVHFHNKERCLKRMLPASTFKVFLSLVALETAVAPDEQFVIKWDSVHRKSDWDKDMNLAEALKSSSEPYFQELAKRIGVERLQHYLDTVHYGSMQMTDKPEQTWTNDTLQISADEQTGFLKRLYFAELPFSERSQRIVKKLMLQEETPGYNIYYKTGTGDVNGKMVLWVVGFAERIQHVKEPKGSMNKSDVRYYPYFFAQNFDVPTTDTSKNWFEVRLEVMRDILKMHGVIPR